MTKWIIGIALVLFLLFAAYMAWLAKGAVDAMAADWEREQLCISKQLQLGSHLRIAELFCKRSAGL